MPIQIRTIFADGSTPKQLLITLLLPGDNEFSKFVLDESFFSLKVDTILQMHLIAMDGGHWAYFDENITEDQTVVFQPLPTGPHGWWHLLHGIDVSNTQRGQGIRIGVIDEGLALQQQESTLAHVDNVGSPGLQHSPRAFNPTANHGLAVTSLIANRANSPGAYEGIAPHADLVFASAASNLSEGLDPGRVADCIEHLTVNNQCDFISISAGELEQESQTILNAVIDAWDFGTVCLFASGNRGNDRGLLYPARYEDCISVAACGQYDFAPMGTAEKNHETNSRRISTELYQWNYSTLGSGVDFVAAGSNIIWSSGMGINMPGNGTSYACPITTGTAAVICAEDKAYTNLARDKERSEYALSLMKKHAVPLDSQHILHGLIRASL